MPVTQNSPVLDCTACGACCQFAGEVLVARSENVPRHLTRSVRNRIGFGSCEAETHVRMARTENDRCIALRGSVGQACSCAIYQHRPTNCREFVPGSMDCLNARSAAGR